MINMLVLIAKLKFFIKKTKGRHLLGIYGIKKAEGEFVCFIDADDYIEKEMIEVLYKACINNNVDIAWCDKILETDDNRQTTLCLYNNEYKMTKVEALRNILLYDTSTCDKLYKKSIFEKVVYPEDRFFEDIIAIYKIIEQVDYIYHVGKAYYHYIQHPDSTVHKEFHLNKMDYAYNAKELYTYICDNYIELKEEANAYYILTITTVITDLYKSKRKFKKEYKQLFNEYKVVFKNNLGNRYISTVKKIMCVFIRMHMLGFVNFVKRIKDNIKYK